MPEPTPATTSIHLSAGSRFLSPGPSVRHCGAVLEPAPRAVYQIDTPRVPMHGHEEIGRFVWGRQSIVLPEPGTGAGHLAVFVREHPGNDRPLEISVNDFETELRPSSLPKGPFLWRVIDLPEGVLRPGSNVVVLRSSNVALNAWTWAVSVAQSNSGSQKSRDQGMTWEDSLLGVDGLYVGDYVCRWSVPVARPVSWVYGPVLVGDGAFTVEAASSGDSTPDIAFETRAGHLTEDTINWNDWRPAEVATASTIQQTRAVLAPTSTLYGITLEPSLPVVPHTTSAYDLAVEPRYSTEVASLRSHFDPSWFRQGTLTDLEFAGRLCSTVHRLWIHEDGDGTRYSPFDAPTIVAWQQDALPGSPTAMCVHFGVALLQFAAASGLSARAVVLGQADNATAGMGGHFVVEIYLRELSRWVCFDADFDLHWEVDGRPASVAEVHDVWRDGTPDRAGINQGETFTRNPNGGDWPIDHFRSGGFSWFGIPLKQDWLANPASRPGHHGSLNYHESDTLWWNTTPDAHFLYPNVTAHRSDIERLGAPLL